MTAARGALGPAFPMYAGSATVSWEGLSVFLTHGHRYGPPQSAPHRGRPGPFVRAHPHSLLAVGGRSVLRQSRLGLSAPGRVPHSCLLYEDGLFRWLTLEGETFHWEVLPPPSKENILSD